MRTWLNNSILSDWHSTLDVAGIVRIIQFQGLNKWKNRVIEINLNEFEWRSVCEMQLKEINYWVRFWSWTCCFCFFRFFLFDRSVAARCSCVNLHFTPVSTQSACSKTKRKTRKTQKFKKWHSLIQIIKKRLST